MRKTEKMLAPTDANGNALTDIQTSVTPISWFSNSSTCKSTETSIQIPSLLPKLQRCLCHTPRARSSCLQRGVWVGLLSMVWLTEVAIRPACGCDGPYLVWCWTDKTIKLISQKPETEKVSKKFTQKRVSQVVSETRSWKVYMLSIVSNLKNVLQCLKQSSPISRNLHIHNL